LNKYEIPKAVCKAARESAYVFVAAPVSSKMPGFFDLAPVAADLYVRYVGTQLWDVAVPPTPNTRGLTGLVGKLTNDNLMPKSLNVQINCHVWLLSTESMAFVRVPDSTWQNRYWVKEPELGEPAA
jgi:hypothetical protein